MAFSEEKLEEFKQIDARILFFQGQANKMTLVYFIGFVGFCGWLVKDDKLKNLMSSSIILALGLLLGIVIIIIHSRAIARDRAYKIVFLEKDSSDLWYESTRLLKNLYNSTGRTRYYGILGLMMHLLAVLLIGFDPAGSFSPASKGNYFLSLFIFVPGLIYCAAIIFEKNDLAKYVSQYEAKKLEITKDQDSKPRH